MLWRFVVSAVCSLVFLAVSLESLQHSWLLYLIQFWRLCWSFHDLNVTCDQTEDWHPVWCYSFTLGSEWIKHTACRAINLLPFTSESCWKVMFSICPFCSQEVPVPGHHGIGPWSPTPGRTKAGRTRSERIGPLSRNPPPVPLHHGKLCSKQWIKANWINFILEAKSMSK